jgi:predicted small lipoprotein YifL
MSPKKPLLLATLAAMLTLSGNACGFKGPPLAPLPDTPEDSDRQEQPRPSPKPRPSATPKTGTK